MTLDSIALASRVTTGSTPLLLMFLGIAIGTDLARHRIPNVLISTMLFCGIALQIHSFGASGLAASVVGMMVGFLILLPFYAVGGMGAGDVKLLAAAGSFLGPWGAVLAGAFTMVAGGALAIAAIGLRCVRDGGVAGQSEGAASGADWRRLPLPYSLAIAVGACAAASQLVGTDGGATW
jgi:prepilin peptidase CpaA